MDGPHVVNMCTAEMGAVIVAFEPLWSLPLSVPRGTVLSLCCTPGFLVPYQKMPVYLQTSTWVSRFTFWVPDRRSSDHYCLWMNINMGDSIRGWEPGWFSRSSWVA